MLLTSCKSSYKERKFQTPNFDYERVVRTDLGFRGIHEGDFTKSKFFRPIVHGNHESLGLGQLDIIQ